MKTDRVLLGLLAASVLAACSSGSGSSLAPTPAKPGGETKTAFAAVTITIPRNAVSRSARGRAFVSPATDGVAVNVMHSTNGVVDYDTTINYNLSPGTASTCAGTDPEVCTLQIPAPVAPSPDVDTFTFTLYDQAPGGTPPIFGKGADELGSGATSSSIEADAGNSISAYIDPLPASVAFKQLVLSGDGYLGFTEGFTLETFDIDLDTIVGGVYDPFDPAISLGVTEFGSQVASTTLSIVPPNLSGDVPVPSACDPAVSQKATITTCRTADALSVTYLQPQPIAFDPSYFASISSTDKAVVANTVPLYVSPIFVLDTVDPASSQTAATFTQGSSGVSPVLALAGFTGTVQLSDPGARTEGTSAAFTPNENSGCNGVIPSGGIVATSASGFKITGVSPAPARMQNSPQTCVITFKDNFGGTVLLDVTDYQNPTAPGT